MAFLNLTTGPWKLKPLEMRALAAAKKMAEEAAPATATSDTLAYLDLTTGPWKFKPFEKRALMARAAEAEEAAAAKRKAEAEEAAAAEQTAKRKAEAEQTARGFGWFPIGTYVEVYRDTDRLLVFAKLVELCQHGVFYFDNSVGLVAMFPTISVAYCIRPTDPFTIVKLPLSCRIM